MQSSISRDTIWSALRKNASSIPDKPFIHSYEGSLSYSEVFRKASGFSEYLSSKGISKGARGCLILPRSAELITAFMGMSKTGVVPAPVNYSISKQEINAFISECRPSVVVVQDRHLSCFDHDILAPGTEVVVVGSSGSHLSWDEACSAPAGPEESSVGFDELAYLNFTTGSSGNPKGAIATHANIYWNTVSALEAMKITADDVHLIMFASFAHPHELFARPLYTGGSVVMLEEINPKTIARTINEKGVTCMMGLAPMYDQLRSHCGSIRLDTLRIAESGGMYTRPDINRGFMDSFGIPILSVWGSTETTGIALANTPEAYRTDGSAGRPCPYYEVRIIDEEGAEVPEGEIGELTFSGEGLISGYYNNPDYPMADGWYRSGDLAWRDPEGYHYFVERKSGLMKVAGLKVYPLQIEITLLSHHAVKEAAVIGSEDRLRGVVPHAYIVKKEGAVVGEDEIRHFCRGKMADYMVPKKVIFMDELPKIGSGKINKRALEAMYK